MFHVYYVFLFEKRVAIFESKANAEEYVDVMLSHFKDSSQYLSYSITEKQLPMFLF